ncbi:hypothetical protein V1477_006582, partial [Vespula maculifrons]
MDLAGLRGGGDTGDGSNAGGSQRDEEIHDGISEGSKVVTERRRDIGSGDMFLHTGLQNKTNNVVEISSALYGFTTYYDNKLFNNFVKLYSNNQ